MTQYCVLWRTDANVILSLVETERDPHAISEDEWADMANHREMVEAGYTPEEMESEPKPSKYGYELIAVAREPVEWIV